MSKGSPPKHQIQRKDTIVAVRLPRTLLEELKDLQKINHFMDTSDEIRFIVRKYCLATLKSRQPTTESLPQSDYLEQKKKDKLIEELQSVLSSLQSTKENTETKKLT